MAVKDSPELPVPDEVPGAVVIRARNRLPLDVVGEMLAILAQEPPLLLCDLTGLAPAGDVLVADLQPARHYLGQWPGTVVVLYSPEPALRAKLTAAHLGDRVLVGGSWLQALAEAMKLLPTVRREHVYLSPVSTAPGLARAFVARTLRTWQLSELIDPAVLVASELVTNAHLHARTVLDLALSYTDARLRIAVTDRGAGVPTARLQLVPDADLTGRGLRLVEAFTRNWGVLPGRPAGKTVWVVLDRTQPTPA